MRRIWVGIVVVVMVTIAALYVRAVVLVLPYAPAPEAPVRAPEALPRAPTAAPRDPDAASRAARDTTPSADTAGPVAPREPAPRVGPDGQALRPDAPAPPLDDADAWRGARADAAERWRRDALALAARFADAEALTDAERAGLLDALDRYHLDVAGVRARMEDGRLAPRAGRAAIASLGERVEAELRALLGDARTEALRHRLEVEAGGAF